MKRFLPIRVICCDVQRILDSTLTTCSTSFYKMCNETRDIFLVFPVDGKWVLLWERSAVPTVFSYKIE